MRDKKMEKIIRRMKKHYEEVKKDTDRYNEILEKYKPQAYPDKQMYEKYYEELINGVREARTGNEWFIQNMTKKDAGAVLVFLGLHHPASPTVLRYLADQKITEREPWKRSVFEDRIYAVSHSNIDQHYIGE